MHQIPIVTIWTGLVLKLSGGDASTSNVSQFNVGDSKKDPHDTCSQWTENFNTWCRLLFRTNCVQSTFTCMKGTWTHVHALWVSQTHDLCVDFDNFHVILIIFYTIFTLLRGQIRVTTHGLQMRRTLIMFRDPLWCIRAQLTGSTCLPDQYWSPDTPELILETTFITNQLKWRCKH